MDIYKFKKLSAVEAESEFSSTDSTHLIVEDGGGIKRLDAENKLLPTPTQEDVGKVPVVQEGGAYNLNDIDITPDDIIDVTGEMTAEQKTQTRENIGAGTPLTPQQIADGAGTWLANNLATPSTPPIDSSLSVANAAADAKAVGDAVGELKSAFANLNSIVIKDIPMVDVSEWVGNTNTAVTSNGDGTYSVGTTDYGTTIFGPTEELTPGDYYLFGIPAGYTFVSTSQSVSNAVATNDTGATAKVTIQNAGTYYIGIRLSAKPTNAFTATPFLLKRVNEIDVLDGEITNQTADWSMYVSGMRSPSTIETVTPNSARCTVACTIKAHAGDTISFTNNTSGQKYALASLTYDSGWQTSDFSYTVPSNNTYLVNIAMSDGTSPISPDDVGLKIVWEGESSRITALEGKATVADARTEAMSKAVETLYTNNVQRNLIGKSVGAYYPVDLKSGDVVAISTSDGNNAPRAARVDFYSANYTLVGYTTLGTSAASKLYTLPADARYVTPHETCNVPIQLEVGTKVTPYQEYPEDNDDYVVDLAQNGYIYLNSANDFALGTFDSSGYSLGTSNRCHSRNMFIKAHVGDRVVASSTTHDLLMAVVLEPLGRGDSANLLETTGWKRNIDTVVQHDGYYCLLAQATPDTFSGSFKVYPYYLNTILVTPVEYYSDEIADTMAKVAAVETEPALVFPLITDIHRYTASVQTFEAMVQNVKAVLGATRGDFLANMGDTIEGNAVQATSLGYARESNSALANLGVEYMYSQGNHDDNPYINSGANTFTIGEVYNGFYSFGRPTNLNPNENGTDFYVDYDAFGVRVISLNSCNVTETSYYAFGDSTAAWLEEALITDKTVIIITHISPISSQVWNNVSPQNSIAVAAKLSAFVSGGGNLIQLSGHSHVDLAFISPWLSVTQVCQKFEQAVTTTEEYQAITGYIDVMGAPARTANTYTADAWSMCVYKPNSNTLHLIRFGAGIDRHFHVTPITPTTVTTMLSGTITWSTSDSSVATVSNGVITGVSSGRCAILAKDTNGNYECWIVDVT